MSVCVEEDIVGSSLITNNVRMLPDLPLPAPAPFHRPRNVASFRSAVCWMQQDCPVRDPGRAPELLPRSQAEGHVHCSEWGAIARD